MTINLGWDPKDSRRLLRSMNTELEKSPDEFLAENSKYLADQAWNQIMILTQYQKEGMKQLKELQTDLREIEAAIKDFHEFAREAMKISKKARR